MNQHGQEPPRYYTGRAVTDAAPGEVVRVELAPAGGGGPAVTVRFQVPLQDADPGNLAAAFGAGDGRPAWTFRAALARLALDHGDHGQAAGWLLQLYQAGRAQLPALAGAIEAAEREHPGTGDQLAADLVARWAAAPAPGQPPTTPGRELAAAIGQTRPGGWARYLLVLAAAGIIDPDEAADRAAGHAAAWDDPAQFGSPAGGWSEAEAPTSRCGPARRDAETVSGAELAAWAGSADSVPAGDGGSAAVRHGSPGGGWHTAGGAIPAAYAAASAGPAFVVDGYGYMDPSWYLPAGLDPDQAAHAAGAVAAGLAAFGVPDPYEVSAALRCPLPLARLASDTPLTMAAGPGEAYWAWRHVALGMWIGQPGEATQDMAAEPATAGQVRQLLAARRDAGDG